MGGIPPRDGRRSNTSCDHCEDRRSDWRRDLPMGRAASAQIESRAAFPVAVLHGAIDAVRASYPLERWPSALSIVILSQVTHHSAIFPPSMRNIAPKSNFALRPDGGNGPICPRCVPS